MNKFKVFLNVICVLVATVSTLTVISLAEPDTTDNADEVATTKVTTEAPSYKETTTAPEEEKSTTKADDEDETTKKSTTTTTEKTTTTKKTTTESDEDEDETTKKTKKTAEYDYGEDEGGTKVTRSSPKTTKTTTTKKAEKNITDYGKRYRWLKWTCYFLTAGSIIALIAINVNYAKQNSLSKVDRKKRNSNHKDNIRRR